MNRGRNPTAFLAFVVILLVLVFMFIASDIETFDTDIEWGKVTSVSNSYRELTEKEKDTSSNVSWPTKDEQGNYVYTGGGRGGKTDDYPSGGDAVPLSPKELEVINTNLKTLSGYSSKEFDAIFAGTNMAGLGSVIVAAEQIARYGPGFNYNSKFAGSVDPEYLKSKGAFNGFREIATDTGGYQTVNAIFIAAVASHESARNTSDIAKDKNNLFGMNAVDGAPYKKAFTYKTTEYSIMDFVGNINRMQYSKTPAAVSPHAIGKSYATDGSWARKTARHMIEISQKLEANRNGMLQ